MAKDFYLNSVDDLHKVSGYVNDHFDASDRQLKVVISQTNNGTLSMLKLWRMWVSQVCDFMNARGDYMPLYFKADGTPVGKRELTPDDVHHAMSTLCLGTYDDNGSQKRFSWALSDKGASGHRVADIGLRLRAMDKLWHLGLEHNIPLVNPEDSEYRKLKDEQDG